MKKIPAKVSEAWIHNGNIYFYRYEDSEKYEKINLPKWVNKAINGETKRYFEMGGREVMMKIKNALEIR